MEKKKNKTIDLDYKDIKVEVEITTHFRPAPPCSNPDSPLFSDCGDDCEFIVHSGTREDGTKLTEEELNELYDDKDFYQFIVDNDVEDYPEPDSYNDF